MGLDDSLRNVLERIAGATSLIKLLPMPDTDIINQSNAVL